MQKKAQVPKRKSVSKKTSVIVGLGASAGGTKSLKNFFSAVDEKSNIAYVVIQHTDETGTALAKKVLQGFTKLPVVEIENGTLLKANHVYFAPPHTFVTLDKNKCTVKHARSREQTLTVIDFFFKSLAENAKVHAVGIILSGEGTDGSQGLKAISDNGGMTIAQDPSSAEHPAMPQNAVSTGIVDHILPAGKMPRELRSYVEYVEKMVDGKAMYTLREEIGHSLTKICEILYRVTHHDFKHYKTTTLIRRIQRRMQVLQLTNADTYVKRLSEQVTEADALFKELLINVTSFFRDPEAFECLRESVLAPAIAKAPANQKFRVWVAGCSSGEEAYTMAILIHEEIERQGKRLEIQIIATDIDEVALTQARKGSYALGIAESVSAERLQRYFQKRAGRYHIQKEVREMVLFSAHNLINDPPFSQLDLITCRNLLIYLGLHLQKKLIPVFHYALKPGGHLFLGTSESLTNHKELFKSVSAKYRIAQRKTTAIRPTSATFTSSVPHNFANHPQEAQRNHEADLLLVGQRIILDEFSPRHVIVNDENQIVSVSSGIQPYLEPAEGSFQNHIVKLVRPSLRVSLRMALKEAHKHKRRIDTESATLKCEDGLRRIGITVQPMPQLGDDSALYMVVFHKLGKIDAEIRVSADAENADSSALVEQLERELGLVREDLDKTVQDLEASNEELKSSNEELLSMNEELQSSNEELEASKEEVQDSNEALQKVNLDLENLLASTQIATLFLDKDLAITNFTPPISEIYRIRDGDIGRDIRDFTAQSLQMPDYPSAASFKSYNDFSEAEILMPDGRVFLRRVHPYKNSEKTVNGLVVSFIDVTELRRSEGRFMTLANAVPVITWTTTPAGEVDFFNARWFEYTGQSETASYNSAWVNALHPEDIPRVVKEWEHSVKTGADYDTEYRIRQTNGNYRWHQARGTAYRDVHGKIIQWFGTCVDIQDQKQAQLEYERNVDTAPAKLWITEANGSCSYLSQKWYRFTGQTPDEALDFGWWNAFHPEDKAKVYEEFTEANKRHRSFSAEARVKNKDGEYQWTIVSANPRFTKQDQFIGLAGSVFNIHSRVIAEQEKRAALEMIAGNQESLDMMIRTSPSFMAVMKGPQFIIEQVNAQYLQLIGHRDVLGKPLMQALPEVHDQGYVELLNQVLSSGEPFVGTEMAVMLQRTASGPLEKRYVDFVFQPHIASKDGTEQIFVHGNDVTEKVLAREAIESERANFRNLFKQTPEMVCIMHGPEHTFEFVNDAHIRALGFDATGMTVREAQPESVEVYSLLDGVYQTGITAELNEIPVTLGDSVRYFNLTYAARRTMAGEINGVMILGMEVTPEVLYRAELQKSKEEADKANQSKTTFLANVSHEIRTPLGAILGFSDLLSMDYAENSEAADFIGRISNNARQLGRLIDELLDLSKIEANRLEIERVSVNINSTVEDVLSAVTPRAKEKNIPIHVKIVEPMPDKVLSDPTRLKQILTNLLGNAVKFTEKGQIDLELKITKEGSQDFLQARVIDTGIGLTEEQALKLFRPFAQGDSSITRKFGGTGLGLVLSQQLAKLMGGDLILEKSNLGEGATFTLRIALGTPQELQVFEANSRNKNPLRAEDYSLKGRKILIVDDAPDNQTLVRLYLSRAKAAHESASDGEEAIQKALSGDFDAVLMDLQMPKVDGHTATQELRKKGYKKPIIALTAHALKGEREKCLEGGFNEYITKPIEKTILLKTLTELLK